MIGKPTSPSRQGKARQGKARQKARQGKASLQGKAKLALPLKRRRVIIAEAAGAGALSGLLESRKGLGKKAGGMDGVQG